MKKLIIITLCLLSLTACGKENNKLDEPINDSSINNTDDKVDAPVNDPNINDKANSSINRPDTNDKMETPEVIPDQSTTKPTENNSSEQVTSKPNTSYTESDMKTIQSFDLLSNEVDTALYNNDEHKVKAAFITIVDFIFYDSEINGIKFDDLTDGAKQNILNTAKTIDEKIMIKFPNYKETISSKAGSAFNKASDLIKKGANNINNFAKSHLGADNYQALIDAKDDLVYYTKNAFSFIKTTTGNLWNSGKNKLKDWYENLKNN